MFIRYDVINTVYIAVIASLKVFSNMKKKNVQGNLVLSTELITCIGHSK